MLDDAGSEHVDQILMAAVAQQNDLAFARLVDRHLDWSLRFVERRIGARADAEDLVQTAFLRVWQGASRWKPHAKFTTWFYRVLHNLCTDHFRGRRARTETLGETLADGAPSREQQMAGIERAAQVRAALEALPERQRAAIVLRYYEERSQAEAAALLGVTEGALESLLARARAELKKRLHEEH